ncbi:DUF2231 domain-containing protein [Thiohalomonas denitrificans]|uniref:DUF2231 domain-containing protein n=1 Tax=Thiohalomonas denitrificans TaxID=415747 RepID=UPI0026ED4693|nr:DUF2231 domain-containing protein [Thiohalomonas denitrificans]
MMMEEEKRNLHRDIRIPSTAAIYSHPLHPMLVTFPIAFFTGTLFSDIAFLWSGDPFWARAAFWLVLSGLVGGAAAAIAGITDFLTVVAIRNKIRSWGHFLAAIALLSFASANMVLRLDHPGAVVFPWGVFLSALTMLMLAFTGYLGGKLVFHELVGTYLTEEEEP